jgi:GPH family glycoside/pentoside/hexuronide:cation symporter
MPPSLTASSAASVPQAAAPIKTSKLPVSVCIGYGVGTIGISIMLNAVSAFYPALMTTVLGQSPEIAGLLLMISKIYDAVMDVVIGTVSDRTRSRWGRRRPYLLIGAFVSATSFLMIFSPPAMSDTWLVVYMMAALILYSSGYALFNVPYVAMSSEMTSGFKERTRLWSFRTFFVSLGQIFSLAGTAALIQFGGGGSHGYRIMGLVLALLIATAMLASFFGTAQAERIERSHGPRVSIRTQLRLIMDNRHFMFLMGAKLFQFLAFASTAGTNLLFVLNVLKIGYSGQIELAIAQNITVAVAMPIWVRIAARIGKKWAYILGVAFYVLGILSWLFAGPDITQAGLIARAIVGGFGSGGMILLSMSMLTDTMAYDRYSTGIHREGIYASIVGILEKGGYAVGIAIIGAYLSAAHYIPTRQGALTDQPASAVQALYMGVAVIPALFFIGNIVCILFYKLDAAALKKAQDGHA